MAIIGGCSCISSKVKSDFALGDSDMSTASRVGIPSTHPPRTYLRMLLVKSILVMIRNHHCRINVKFVKDIRACTTILPLDFPRRGQDTIDCHDSDNESSFRVPIG